MRSLIVAVCGMGLACTLAGCDRHPMPVGGCQLRVECRAKRVPTGVLIHYDIVNTGSLPCFVSERSLLSVRPNERSSGLVFPLGNAPVWHLLVSEEEEDGRYGVVLAGRERSLRREVLWQTSVMPADGMIEVSIRHLVCAAVAGQGVVVREFREAVTVGASP